MLVIDDGGPLSFQEPMQDEMDSLQKKIKTMSFLQLLKGRKSLKNKWVFKWLRDMVEENVVKLKKIHIKKYLKHVDKGCS